MQELDLAYIEKIMNLQENILNGIENKEIYAASTAEEFEEVILSKGKIIGCVTEEDNLIAMGVYVENGYDNHNYGYDLEMHGEELLKVCQIESTVVDEVYRGNRLQKVICETIENIARKRGMKFITATANATLVTLMFVSSIFALFFSQVLFFHAFLEYIGVAYLMRVIFIIDVSSDISDSLPI